MIYAPIRTKFVSQSEVTNKLLKRKRILEFFGGKAEEWLELADDFLTDNGRLNHAYCMAEFRKLANENAEPEAFEYIMPPEPDVPIDDTAIELQHVAEQFLHLSPA